MLALTIVVASVAYAFVGSVVGIVVTRWREDEVEGALFGIAWPLCIVGLYLLRAATRTADFIEGRRVTPELPKAVAREVE